MAGSGPVAVRQPVPIRQPVALIGSPYARPNSGRSESTGSPLGGLGLEGCAFQSPGASSPVDLLRTSSEDSFPWILSYVEDPYGSGRPDSSSTSDGTESSRPVCDTPVPTTSREEGFFRQRSKSLDGPRYPSTWKELEANEAEGLSKSCPETGSTLFRDMIARFQPPQETAEENGIWKGREEALWNRARKGLFPDRGIEGGTRPKE